MLFVLSVLKILAFVRREEWVDYGLCYYSLVLFRHNIFYLVNSSLHNTSPALTQCHSYNREEVSQSWDVTFLEYIPAPRICCHNRQSHLSVQQSDSKATESSAHKPQGSRMMLPVMWKCVVTRSRIAHDYITCIHKSKGTPNSCLIHKSKRHPKLMFIGMVKRTKMLSGRTSTTVQ
jgi:hypothetical protein